jgi:hypothetical protein
MTVDRDRLLAQAAAELRALAGQRLVDPTDALALLPDPDRYIGTDEVNSDAIIRDLDELVRRKPYLARANHPRPPLPDYSQGSSANGRRPPSTPAETFASWFRRQL